MRHCSHLQKKEKELFFLLESIYFSLLYTFYFYIKLFNKRKVRRQGKAKRLVTQIDTRETRTSSYNLIVAASDKINNAAYCLDLHVAPTCIYFTHHETTKRSVDGEGSRPSDRSLIRMPELPFVLSNLTLTAVISMAQPVPDGETGAPCRSHTCDPDDSSTGGGGVDQ